MTPMLAAFLLQVQPPFDLDEALNRAYIEQAAGNRAKAIALYQRILATPNPTDPESLKKQLPPRHRAQWQLAVCLEDESKYADALAAYQKAEAGPSGSSCGNSSNVHYQMGQGRCLELLGRHKEAVEVYFKAAERTLNGVAPAPLWRLVELFEAAGQTDDLLAILDRLDRESMLKHNREHSSTTPIRFLIDARDAGRQEKWGTLVDLLDAQGGLCWSHPRSPNLVAAAHSLAGRPEKTVPLLQAKLEAAIKNDRSWLYYSLGLCGTPGALKTLKERGQMLGRLKYKDLDMWELRDVCYALNLSGPGRAILKEFISSDIEHLKFAIVDVNEHPEPSVPLNQRWFGGFPPIPKDLRLN